MKNYILLCAAVLLSWKAATQPALDWNRTWGGTGVDEGIHLSADASGRVYVCGYFTRQAAFEEGKTIESRGGGDAFVRELDPRGKPLRLLTWGDAHWNAAYSVTTDAQGKVYALVLSKNAETKTQTLGLVQWNEQGELGRAVVLVQAPDITPGDLRSAESGVLFVSYSLPASSAAGQPAHYLLQLDVEGNRQALFAHNAGRAFVLDGHVLLRIDASGNLLAERISDQTPLWSQPIADQVQRLCLQTPDRLCLLLRTPRGKLRLEQRRTEDGHLLWSRDLEASAEFVSDMTASPQGKLYLSAKCQGNMALYAYSEQGNPEWQYILPHTAHAAIYHITTDARGNLLATGYFSERIQNPLLVPAGNRGANDAFLLRWQIESNEEQGQAQDLQAGMQTEAALELELKPCYPNPARTHTLIDFSVQTPQRVQLALYDALGRRLQVLFEGQIQGLQQVRLSVQDLPPGVYFYGLTAPDLGLQAVRQLIVEGN